MAGGSARFREPKPSVALLLWHRDMVAARRSPLRLVGGREEGRPSDADLAEAIAAAEPWAATATWNKHAPMVFRFLHRALGSAADAEDLTQDVFAVVFARAGELKNREALGSFVFSIAVRLLKWELRRRRARRIFELSGEGDLPDYPVPAVDSESRDALRRFYGILDHLGAEERAVFALRYLEGLKVEEVAQALGTSMATAKRRLQRASQIVSRRVGADPALAPYIRLSGGYHDD